MTSYEDAYRHNQREAGDCAVLALAAVCGVSYMVAHEAMDTAGRAKARGTPNEITRAALDLLGWEVRREWSVTQFALELGVKKPALADLEGKDWLPRMMVFVNGHDHVVPFWSGRVHDWSRDTEALIDNAWEVARIGIVSKTKPAPVIFL